ncbi:MAG: LTA synthase family protein [Lachnospiraceae bacterium]|nr:LTA synthase family protein [Lachnospiraceae bacterium]
MSTSWKQYKTGRNIATGIFLLLTNMLLVLTVWVQIRFSSVDMTTVIFQLKVPIEGADASNFYEIFIFLGTIAPAMLLVEIALFQWAAHIRRKRAEKSKTGGVSGWILRHRKMIAAVCLIAAVSVLMFCMHIVKYVVHQFGNSPIYDDEYVGAETVMIKAPEKKKNLIYIYMESMEDSYADREHGGASKENMIPEMTEIAVNNINFTPKGSNQLNGAQAVVGTTWTMASLVANTGGVPLTIPINQNAMGYHEYRTFLPGVYNLGQVLAENDYNLAFLIGSEKEFSGADIFMTTHGDYTIHDYQTFKDVGWIQPDYKVWWGVEDEKVYDYAIEVLTQLTQEDKPFALTMMTMDTHFTDGFRCRLCGTKFPDQYSNVIACASKQLDKFLDWLSRQPYYEDTTIIVVGDHPTMDTKYTGSLPYNDSKYVRKCYCAVLNSSVDYTLSYARDFTSMDMFPTTLAAMGFTIPGDRLGIGVNLFADTPTMLEKYGVSKLNDLLEERSDFYDELLYGPPAEREFPLVNTQEP